MTSRVVVGVDGGGGHVAAVGVVDGEIVFRGAGGPGNPLAVDVHTLESSYRDALAGCPTPDVIGVCAAGAGGPKGRSILEELIGTMFPGAVVAVGGDYRAVLAAAPGYDMWVIAGTGSVVVSIDGEQVRSSGGRGWLLGDHGSGSRLGRGLLEFYVNCPNPGLAREVEGLAGTAAWLDLVRRAQSGPEPAAFLATFAPLLCQHAEAGDVWAVDVLDAEMRTLAATAAAHSQAWLAHTDPVKLCLAGGVWSATAARDTFIRQARLVLSDEVKVDVPVIDAALGAAAFAGGAGVAAGSRR